MRYAKGIMWLADCRIPFVDEKEIWTAKRSETNNPFHLTINKDGVDYGNQQGRFTPNLLVCDDMLNDGVITKQNTRTYNKDTCGGGIFPIKSNGRTSVGDSGSSSRYYDLDKWFDKVIDEIR